MKPIRVLVVEDSRLIQSILEDTIKSDGGFELVGLAASGEEGLAMAKTMNPDVVSLDVVLPDMDGLSVVEGIMAHGPIPIMMLSTLTEPDNFVAIKAMQIGAMDCMEKPKDMHANMDLFRRNYLQKLKQVAAIPRAKILQAVNGIPSKPRTAVADTLIVLGSTMGGAAALAQALTEMPPNLKACILVLQHLNSSFTKPLVTDLATSCKMRVKEAEVGDVFVEGLALIAPGNQTVKVVESRSGWSRVSISTETPLKRQMRPWIDKAMETAAAAFRARTIGVLLSGLGGDGVKGLQRIKEVGGATFAQSDSGNARSELVQAAVDAKVVDKVLPTKELAKAIVDHVNSLKQAALDLGKR